ncbi:MAG: hypothetical protein JWM68_4839 [Verrucomicrobiales bacterium]|nr:hypothetical protein [Verrucomicrobiales bacterium]
MGCFWSNFSCFKKTDFPVAKSLFRGILSALWALSSVVEHLVYTEMAGGSNPSAPTIFGFPRGKTLYSWLRWNSCGLAVMYPMPTIKISVPHQLGADEAKRRITTLISETKAQFGKDVSDLQENWSGDQGKFSFTARGFSVSGNLLVEPTNARMDINLPFAAMLFKSKIEKEISSRAKELLS